MNHRRLKGFLALLALSCALPLASMADEPIDYGQKDNWLCRADNLRYCDTDLTTTVVQADGSMAREEWKHDEQAPIDCFYVYPTVSRDTTPNSDMDPGVGEINVIKQQFARFGSECRMFAPLYRQVTLTALRAGLGGDSDAPAPDRAMGYQDVVKAWNYYLENFNDGRGVVLIGHSQGSGVLSRLIPAEIEGKPIQDQIISALIIGSNVQVPKGKLVGGTFKKMPLCQSGDDLGCVVAYASFRSTVPPPADGLFGRGGQDTVSACTNPAQLAKGSNDLHAYLGNSVSEGASSAPPKPWTNTGKKVDTPFVSVPGLLSAECVSNAGRNYLEVTVHGDPADPRTDDISGDVLMNGEVSAGWGLHLIDVNLAMGDLVTLVRKQGKNYLARQ
ncbi:DUF3089 domain-containing protein [Gilvimarinus sp. F26214L]|uniref:DUF3089 domain-containing protein n=1 Tax=Gilvimarinus sp. DZF01 TaxID=3461371 RepID=UPI004045C93B